MSEEDEKTSLEFGGVKFTGGKMFAVITALTTLIGGLYGGFEVYKDYQDMKAQIQSYVAPDLSDFDKRLDVINKDMTATKEMVAQTTEYTNNIKNDLKTDIRSLQSVVDSVERSTKQSQRDTDISVKDVQTELRQTRKELDLAIKETNQGVDKKIQRALDNPLAN